MQTNHFIFIIQLLPLMVQIMDERNPKATPAGILEKAPDIGTDRILYYRAWKSMM